MPRKTNKKMKNGRRSANHGPDYAPYSLVDQRDILPNRLKDLITKDPNKSSNKNRSDSNRYRQNTVNHNVNHHVNHDVNHHVSVPNSIDLDDGSID